MCVESRERISDRERACAKNYFGVWRRTIDEQQHGRGVGAWSRSRGDWQGLSPNPKEPWKKLQKKKMRAWPAMPWPRPAQGLSW